MFRQATVPLAILITFIIIGLIIERSITPIFQAEYFKQAMEYGAQKQLETPPRPFHFDGCTLFPDRIGRTSFLYACLNHDIAYWYGGDKNQRRIADLKFREEIKTSGLAGKYLNWPMYIAVRVFGDTWILKQFNANWGFGYNE